MDFDFSEEQYSFRDSVRAFLNSREDVFASGNARLTQFEENEIWSTLTDLGTFSALVPEKYGGLGLTFVDVALVLEEFGRQLVPALVIETLVGTELIARFGSEEQKVMLLPRIAEGRLKLTSALLEATAGFEPSEISTGIR